MNLKIPKISVALCTYNGVNYLEEQIASILSQTCPPFELIISDDHSIDGSLNLVEKVCQETSIPVRVLRSNSGNQGVKRNFQRAILACSGDYIALSDQDDIWYEDKLELFTKAIMDSDPSTPTLFYSNPELIDSFGNKLGETFFSRAGIRPPEMHYWKFLVTRNFAPGCCTVFDTRLVGSLLPFPPESIIHDWWINLIFSLRGSVCRVKSPTMLYRLHADNNQGISSYGKTIEVGVAGGFMLVATDNLAIAVRQVKGAATCLRKEQLRYPDQLDQFLEIFDHARILRPFMLLRLGISRGNTIKTFFMLIASIFVSTKQLEKEGGGYR